MMEDSVINALTRKLSELLENEPSLFVVDLYIKPGNIIKIFVDGDQGISVSQLAFLNRSLYKWTEEAGIFPNGDFSMELSSPGLDEPLKQHRQYIKNIGRPVEVVLKNGIKKEGKLTLVNDLDFVIEEEKGKGKKKELVSHTISFEETKTTKIQIKF